MIKLSEKIKKIAKNIRGKITAFLAKRKQVNQAFHITNSQWNAKISETRDTEASEVRDMEH
ncbi:MAG: hypothetical protein WCX69_05310 [Candidatus Paceibacterota bacterium]